MNEAKDIGTPIDARTVDADARRMVMTFHVLSRTCGEQVYESDEAERHAFMDAQELVRHGVQVTIWKTIRLGRN